MLGRLGSLLDVHECCVDFEHVCKVLGAPRSEVVAANTENKGNLALNTENKGNLALMGTDGVNGSRSGPGSAGG